MIVKHRALWHKMIGNRIRGQGKKLEVSRKQPPSKIGSGQARKANLREHTGFIELTVLKTNMLGNR